MNVSTFTKKEKYEYITGLVFLTFLLVYSRRFPLFLFAIFPALGAALFIMRTRILRRFAKTPVRQVAYADLMEPVYRTEQVRDGETGELRTVDRIVGYKRCDFPLIRHIDPCYVDLVEYITKKGNPSVLICGRSGMGKSELMKVLLLSSKGPKIILSFKPNDAYLHIPSYQAIDVLKHIPNPFKDPDALSIAHSLANPANVRGIMLSQVRAIVKNLARESESWDEFGQNLKRMQRNATDIQREALALIEEQTECLAVGEGSFSIDLAKDTVLDFSHLDESAKTFYAEIALRQIWKELTGRAGGAKNEKVLIVVDEVWRLTQQYEMDARSVIDTLTRQVRQFGRLYTATQNYSDIADSQRNQFGTQLTFNTTSEQDLQAIGKIDPGYVWIVKELRQHEFIDLTFHVGNVGLVPIFEADLVELPEREVEYDEPVDVHNTQPQKATIDYGAMVRERIDSGEVVWVSGLATLVEERYRVDNKDAAKLKLRDVLLKLLSAGEVQVQKYDDAESGETVSLYFAKSEDEKISGLHRYMVGKLVSRLKENQERIVSVAESGQSLPDVETVSSYFEIETGLKTRTSDLEERISKLSAIKPFVILVPNSEIAKSERYSSLKSPRVVLATLAEFLRGEAKIPR